MDAQNRLSEAHSIHIKQSDTCYQHKKYHICKHYYHVTIFRVTLVMMDLLVALVLLDSR